ncbi:hypothetical protein GIB67_028048 [Kingdonia uniflora]|uniref:Uncharacterized protein n=1 Tax=Kingdonia uniflora TaxID=39325 RepID=A0A7J7L1A7_9MAGN|nr:hypothetical protein GIB67_028048 [Kingdonia uniflora]
MILLMLLRGDCTLIGGLHDPYAFINSNIFLMSSQTQSEISLHGILLKWAFTFSYLYCYLFLNILFFA